LKQPRTFKHSVHYKDIYPSSIIVDHITPFVSPD
jgi:hypothetical protein